ncbi:MAG: hypothetical protein ACRDGH_12730, partial [Candidatus Limnocylindria bacterium]
MEPDDPAYRGQGEYSPFFLRIYDPLILGVFTRGVALPDSSSGGAVPQRQPPSSPGRGPGYRL